MADAWTTLTEDDVLSGITDAESTALRTKLLKSGQADPLTEILTQVTLEIRGAIRSCEKNSLDADPAKLPESAVYHAVALARYRLFTRFVGGISDDRKEEWREANRWKREVARCEYRVEAPGTEDGGAAPQPGPCITPATRDAQRADADGV